MTTTITAASLDDPLYYLKNIDTVLLWVVQHHSDLFNHAEQVQLATIQALDTASRACLYRLMTRRGEWFRDDKVVYAEINNVTAALDHLATHNLIEYPAACQFTTLVSVCRLPELTMLWHEYGRGDRPSGKDALVLSLCRDSDDKAQLATDWLPSMPFELIKLECQALFETVKILFFGNAQQDWSEFVVTELGHQRYERVALDRQQRAFDNREVLDTFQHLSALSDAQYMARLPAEDIIEQLPDSLNTPWLEYRRQKILFRAAHAIEREGKLEYALSLYRRCLYREAKIRQLRVMEKLCSPHLVCRYAGWLTKVARRDDWREAAYKVWRRSAAKCGVAIERPTRFSPSQVHTVLEKSHYSVERALARHLSRENAPCYYVENGLFPGLFALTFWDVWFAPLPGAFFNPFQRRPADLYQEDFAERRQPLITQAWQTLDGSDYASHILARYHDKAGTANPFAIWGLLNDTLLQHALTCIPRAHLRAIFERIWDNLRQHSSGFPDLIHFDLTKQTYQLIEVKAPGDKLQDHQLRWLTFFAQQGIDAHVCHVQWQAS